MKAESMPPIRERWNKRAVLQLIWPLMVEQVLGVTIGLVDTMMMTGVGEYAISGVSLVNDISNLLIIAFGALATGGAVVISQYLGRRDLVNANSAANQLIYVCAIVSSLIMIVAVIFRTFLLRAIYGDVGGDVMQAASTYFLFGALSYPALAVYNASAALFRSMGNSRVTMMVSLLINVLHVILNFILIYGFDTRVTGAAISTLVSRVLGAVMLMYLLVKGIKGRNQPLSLAGILKVRFNFLQIRSILKVGIPSGIESSFFQLGKLLVSRIPAIFGPAAIAANAVTSSINSLTIMPGNALGLAMVTIVGQCVGAADYESARFYVKRLMTFTFISGAVISVLIFVFVEPIVGFFNLGGESHKTAVEFLRLISFMMVFFWPGAFVIHNALRASGDVKYVMIVAIVSMWIVRVFGAYVFVFYFDTGVIGIWYAWVSDWVIRSFFFTGRWISGKWQGKRILAD